MILFSVIALYKSLNLSLFARNSNEFYLNQHQFNSEDKLFLLSFSMSLSCAATNTPSVSVSSSFLPRSFASSCSLVVDFLKEPTMEFLHLWSWSRLKMLSYSSMLPLHYTISLFPSLFSKNPENTVHVSFSSRLRVCCTLGRDFS